MSNACLLAAPQSCRPESNFCRRFRRRILNRKPAHWDALSGLVALTFTPSRRRNSFLGKTLMPAGAADAEVLVYGSEDCKASLSQYQLRLRPDGGLVVGGADEGDCCHEIFGAAGNDSVDPQRDGFIADTLLRLDCQAAKFADKQDSLRRRIILPRVWLGFAPDQPPEFEVTPALSRLAAGRAEIPLARLQGNPSALVDRLLRDTWEAVLAPPLARENSLGLLMVDAEYCTQAQRALRLFVDFRHLLGAATWNPAHRMTVLRFRNPAEDLLREQGVDRSLGFDAIPQPVVEQLEARFRELLGDLSGRFTQLDLFDAITNPQEPLTATCEVFPRMRRSLPRQWSECSTDEDLRCAARNPDRPLVASGACRIQVLHRKGDHPLQFGPEELGRRATLDWEPRPPQPESEELSLSWSV